MGFSGAKAAARGETPPHCGDSTGTPAAGSRGTDGTGGTGETGKPVDTDTAAVGNPRLAEPTGKGGRVDRPPQTQAGTASWPACVLQGAVVCSGCVGGKGGTRGTEVRLNELEEEEKK